MGAPLGWRGQPVEQDCDEAHLAAVDYQPQVWEHMGGVDGGKRHSCDWSNACMPCASGPNAAGPDGRRTHGGGTLLSLHHHRWAAATCCWLATSHRDAPTVLGHSYKQSQ
ncbi:unnamed protein product [Miscanthus lutarioriparius]|uniref:Uncharacterized protein n=1 Tax=Miscanthus lutarioriparius TaxID=422564 RepID=A0A811RGN6_9POAL|nr:unnamed protein product [Miscanthus lutarioriparius]